jgi:hypothetical protein
MKLCTLALILQYIGSILKITQISFCIETMLLYFILKYIFCDLLLIIINYSFSLLHRLMGSQLTVDDQLLNGIKFN